MAKGMTWDIIANTKPAVAGIKDVGAALEDVGSSLDDLAKEAQQSGDGIERGIEQGADGARLGVESATEKMERSFKELADVSKREAKQGGDAVAKEYRDGTKKAGAAVEDFKDEARSNFGETVSSFSGDMEGVVGGIQGTLGGLATTLTPAGAIGAGIVAAGIGTAASFYTAWKEQQDAIAANFREMYLTAAEDGRTFLTEAEIQAEAFAMLRAEDQSRVDGIRRDAEKIGVDFQTLLLANAGDLESLAVAAEAARKAYAGAFDEAINRAPELNATSNEQLNGISGVIGELDILRSTYDKNAKQAGVAAEIAETLGARQRDAAIKATGGFLRTGESIDGVAEKLRTLPTPEPRRVRVVADTSEFYRGINAITSGVSTHNVRVHAVDKYGRRLD